MGNFNVRTFSLDNRAELRKFFQEMVAGSPPSVIREYAELPDGSQYDALQIGLTERFPGNYLPRTHVLLHPKLVQGAARDPEALPKANFVYRFIGIRGGRGIFSSGYNLWKKQKDPIKFALTKDDLHRFHEPIQRNVHTLVDQWQTEHHTPDLFRDLRRFSIRIFFEKMFDVQTEHMSGPVTEDGILDHFEIINKRSFEQLRTPVAYLKRSAFTDDQSRMSVKYIETLLDQICARQLIKKIPGDFISGILEGAGYYNKKDRKSKFQAYDELFHIMIAGFMTTSSALSWTMYELGKNQDWQTEIAKEIQREIGDKPITPRNIYKLKALSAFIEETMRLYPVAPVLVPRRASKRFNIADGYSINKHDIVLFSLFNIHTDKRWFTDPLTHNPSNFEPQAMAERNQKTGGVLAHIPFFEEAHACPGRHLALVEMKMLLAEMIRHLVILKPEKMLGKIYGALMTPESGFSMNFSERGPIDFDHAAIHHPSSQAGGGGCPFHQHI